MGNTPSPAARLASMNGASQAALAALQIHLKKQDGPTPAANRFLGSGVSQRSNSLRTYTYNPKPSYVAGNLERSYSLRLAPRAQQPVRRQQSVAQRPRIPEEHAEDDVHEVIVTKTTKVVDASGRTRSITTETTRTLPDGTNVIETKTTNISRSTSRNNSLRANSLQYLNAANVNLGKIDEDLHDFDYTYLDAPEQLHHTPPRLNESHEPRNWTPATEAYIQEQREALASARRPAEPAASLSSNSSSPVRLKSILKSAASPNRHEQSLFVSPPQLQASPVLRHGQHSITLGALIKFLDHVEQILYPAEPNLASHNGGELGRELVFHEQQEKQRNVDLYNKAMEVAMKRVYGAPEVTPTTPEQRSPKLENSVGQLAAKKSKLDTKIGKNEAAGVNPNYVYENHHKDFAVRSLRQDTQESHSTRKERAKEERKQLKEEEKRRAELLKAAEKEQKEQAKKQKKPFGLFSRRRRSSSKSDDSVHMAEAAVAYDNSAIVSNQAEPHVGLDGQVHGLAVLPDTVEKGQNPPSSATGLGILTPLINDDTPAVFTTPPSGQVEPVPSQNSPPALNVKPSEKAALSSPSAATENPRPRSREPKSPVSYATTPAVPVSADVASLPIIGKPNPSMEAIVPESDDESINENDFVDVPEVPEAGGVDNELDSLTKHTFLVEPAQKEAQKEQQEVLSLQADYPEPAFLDIPEAAAPTLVAGANGHPVVLVDETQMGNVPELADREPLDPVSGPDAQVRGVGAIVSPSVATDLTNFYDTNETLQEGRHVGISLSEEPKMSEEPTTSEEHDGVAESATAITESSHPELETESPGFHAEPVVVKDIDSAGNDIVSNDVLPTNESYSEEFVDVASPSAEPDKKVVDLSYHTLDPADSSVVNDSKKHDESNTVPESQVVKNGVQGEDSQAAFSGITGEPLASEFTKLSPTLQTGPSATTANSGFPSQEIASEAPPIAAAESPEPLKKKSKSNKSNKGEKRGDRIRKIIDKYFINTYNR